MNAARRCDRCDHAASDAVVTVRGDTNAVCPLHRAMALAAGGRTLSGWLARRALGRLEAKALAAA